MPLYRYVAADVSGRKLSESLEATNEAALKDELRRKGLVPLSIKAVDQRRRTTLQSVTKKDLLRFTQELGSLLESGLPLDRALYVLSEHSEKAPMRSVIRDIYIDIQKGQSLSQAVAKHKAFPRMYVNMVRAGEAGGMLDAVIKRLAAFLETTIQFRDEVNSALIYPLLLVTVGGLAVSVLLFYVIPKFARIFGDMGQTLPTPTRVLLGISGFLVSYWWVILAAIVVSVLALRSYIRTAEGRAFMDNLKLTVPVVRTVHMKLVISRFARTLGTLIQSGVPILESIRISREVLGNEVLSARLAVVEEGVRRGRGVAKPISESGVFPPIVAQMISVGEEAGRLEETFVNIAERFEGESKITIRRTISLLEPAMILVMGLVVALIVLSMIIAVFSINEIPL